MFSTLQHILCCSGLCLPLHNHVTTPPPTHPPPPNFHFYFIEKNPIQSKFGETNIGCPSTSIAANKIPPNTFLHMSFTCPPIALQTHSYTYHGRTIPIAMASNFFPTLFLCHIHMLTHFCLHMQCSRPQGLVHHCSV